ncbi:MAG: hypothetical protein H7Y38_19535 [Armatimonadetes bacterium]|nr:hypothetical protein [Armatimonadota bacterium]
MYRIPMTRVAALAASLASLALLAGCGGDDNNDSDLLGLSPVVTTPGASRYAGTYNDAISLLNGATATTNIVVAPNGIATGTLTVSGGTATAVSGSATTRGTRQATAFSFVAGTYAISGTVNPTTGAFQMTGNIGGQPFSYSGNLPTPGGDGGLFSLTAGTQVYTSSFASPGGGTTPAPSPVVSPSPTVNPSPLASPSGTPLNITFSAVDGVQNVDTSAFTSANQTLLQAYAYGAGTAFQSLTILANSSVAGSTDPNRSRRFVVQFFDLAPIVGATYSPGGTLNCGVQFYQFENNTGVSPAGRLYNGSGGTVTVVARTATSITVRVSNMTMTPGNYIAGLPTTGAFVASGEITAPIQ